MIDAVYAGLGILVGGALGWWLGMRAARSRAWEQVARLRDSLRAGRLPAEDPGAAVDLPGLEEVRSLMAKGWVPRGHERDEGIRSALVRLAVYLRQRVSVPLREALGRGGAGAMEGAEAALDAVEDLEFFLGPPPAGEAETRNLMELIHEVTREFASQSSVLLKVSGPQEPVRVRVRAEALMDALFLVLHNAGEFGGGAPVRVSVVRREGMASVLVRDQGPGFTPEAMQRAFEPLYSTSPGGLGLGLPHARQVVRDQGGDIELRNLEGGGAEVEILIPEMAPYR